MIISNSDSQLLISSQINTIENNLINLKNILSNKNDEYTSQDNINDVKTIIKKETYNQEQYHDIIPILDKIIENQDGNIGKTDQEFKTVDLDDNNSDAQVFTDDGNSKLKQEYISDTKHRNTEYSHQKYNSPLEQSKSKSNTKLSISFAKNSLKRKSTMPDISDHILNLSYRSKKYEKPSLASQTVPNIFNFKEIKINLASKSKPDAFADLKANIAKNMSSVKLKINEQMKQFIRNKIQDNNKMYDKEDEDQAEEFMTKSMIGNQSLVSFGNMDLNHDIEEEEDESQIKQQDSESSKQNKMKSKSQKSRKTLAEEQKTFKSDYQNEIHMFSDINMSKSLTIFKPSDQIQIAENSIFCLTWNIFITIILAFQIIMFPLENYSEKWLVTNDINLYLQIIFEWFFVIDIILNFFTAFKNKYGHSVKKLDEIVMNQLQTWFFLDFISSIPSNTLDYLQIIETTGNQNVQFKLLKLPKQLRILKGVMGIFERGISSNIDIDEFISLSKMEQNRLINVIKQFLFFSFIVNSLSCQLIGLTDQCKSIDTCVNWYFPLVETEQQYLLVSPNVPLYTNVQEYQQTYGDEGVLLFQNYLLKYQRHKLYLDAYQFIVQTVTTVGQGDIGTLNTHERTLRTVCMVIGTIFFSLLVSNFLEQCIAETFNIQKKNEHELMIEKLQSKYSITGDSKRFLNLLGDSVYTESLYKELEFTRLLPKQMCETVLRFIWKTQLNKMQILQDESLTFFIMMMRVANFRRSVQDEQINGKQKLSIVYSGKIGCQVEHLKEFVQQEFLQQVGVGQELGQHNQVHFESEQNNQVQKCTVNCELIELDVTDFLMLVTYSLKGLDQVYERIIEFLIELQMMVALYYSMLKVGLQIEYKWYKNMMGKLNFDELDFIIMERMKNNFTDQKPKDLDEKVFLKQSNSGKWFTHILDNELQKQIYTKCRDLVPELLNKDQDILNQFIQSFKDVKDKKQNQRKRGKLIGKNKSTEC